MNTGQAPREGNGTCQGTDGPVRLVEAAGSRWQRWEAQWCWIPVVDGGQVGVQSPEGLQGLVGQGVSPAREPPCGPGPWFQQAGDPQGGQAVTRDP